MPDKIIEDVKTGLRGLRGAGDALRGDLLAATDRALDSDRDHAATRAATLESRAIAQKGREDMRAVDERLAEREREREEAASRRHGQSQPQPQRGPDPAAAATATAATAANGLAGNGARAPRGTGHHPLPMQ